MGACGRMYAGACVRECVRGCARVRAHTLIEKTPPPTQKKEALFREASRPIVATAGYFKNVNLYKVESI
jgi:hypothetical protein